jgi:hypothetical protein
MLGVSRCYFLDLFTQFIHKCLDLFICFLQLFDRLDLLLQLFAVFLNQLLRVVFHTSLKHP